MLRRPCSRAFTEILSAHTSCPRPRIASASIASSCLHLQSLPPYRCFTSSPTKLAASSAPPRDDAIRARLVRLVDPETGSLSPRPQRPRDILASIDRSQYWLVQVTNPKRSNEEEPSSQRAMGSPTTGGNAEAQELELPIVKLVSKKEAYDKQRAAKRAKAEGGSDASGSAGSSSASAASSAPKEVQLTWSSTPHDISHKLGSIVEKHLQRKGPGAKCTVIISSKKGKGKDGGADASQKAEIIARVEDIICGDDKWSETSHARRRKDVEWQRNGSAALLQFEVVKGKRPTSQ